jgi:integrase
VGSLRLRPFHTLDLIHRSAWKDCSPKFAGTRYPSPSPAPIRGRFPLLPSGSASGSSRLGCDRSLKALLERTGLPPMRFHDLRHTCATLLLSRNVNPKIVSEMLGHSCIGITLDTYSHVLPNMQQSAVRALEEAL